MCQHIVNKGEFACWIVSFCILMDKTLRKMAIVQMASVYRDASTVVVLDKTLEQTSIQGTSPEKLLVRIYISSWMQRIWTFQEGFLAKNLLFHMKDGLCPLKSTLGLEDMIGPLRPLTTENQKRVIYMAVPSTLTGFTTSDLPINASSLSRASEWRHTSKKGDSLLAAAVLLNLDVMESMCYDEGENLKQFFKMIQVLS